MLNTPYIKISPLYAEIDSIYRKFIHIMSKDSPFLVIWVNFTLGKLIYSVVYASTKISKQILNLKLEYSNV